MWLTKWRLYKLKRSLDSLNTSLVCLALFRTAHVNRFGDYTFEFHRKIGRLDFKATIIAMEPSGWVYFYDFFHESLPTLLYLTLSTNSSRMRLDLRAAEQDPALEVLALTVGE